MSTLQAPVLTELPTLTGMRGFATLWVLLYHAWVDAVPRSMRIGIGDHSIDVTPVFSGGMTGVDVFFTLSAFLLALPFAEWQAGVTARPSLRTFWLRRVLRIFPAYYAQIAFLAVVAAGFGIGTLPGTRQLLGNLVLWFNVGRTSVAPINPIAYTLTIEFCFYLVLPILALLLRPRWWIVLLVFALVETQLWRHVVFDPALDIPQRLVLLEQMPGRLDQFVFGMLAAYAWVVLARSQRLPSTGVADAMFVGGAIGVALVLGLISRGFATYWDGSWLLYVSHGVLGAAVALMLFACAAGSSIARVVLDNPSMRYLGLVSFGIYLWHPVILHALDAVNAFGWIDGYRLPWSLPVLLALSCAAAHLSYRVIEKPLLRLGRRSSQRPGVATEMVPLAAER